MHDQSFAPHPGYLFIIIGLLTSLISALVPHFDAGHRLMTSVLVAGMLPSTRWPPTGRRRCGAGPWLPPLAWRL